MARQVDVVHHHSGRRVVWFPPLSKPDVLMQGIERYGVGWVVVTDKDWSYWLPKESDIFALLDQAHPDVFRLQATGPKWRVYAVNPGASFRAEAQPDVAAAPGSAN